MLLPDCIYPAPTFDRGALSEDPPYSGDLPMGTRLALPKSLDLEALDLASELGWTVARAAQEYGLIIVDRVDEGLTLIAEAGLADEYGWSPVRARDRQQIARELRRAHADRAGVALDALKEELFEGREGGFLPFLAGAADPAP